MVAVQGKASRDILGGLIEEGALPEPLRNELSLATLRLGDGRLAPARIARTGYTGEPVAFELFVAAHDGPALWDALVTAGAVPVGLGARDTLRLEAGLPLYGHELGVDPEGDEIPIFSCPLATFAVSFSPLKGDFIGRHALQKQQRAYARILQRDYSLLEDLPRLTRPVAADRPRHRPRGSAGARGGRRALRRRDLPRVGHERHRRALLGPGGRGPLLHPDRGARAALHRPRLPRQPGAGGRRGRGRRARPARPGTGRAPPPAQRRPALRARDHLGPHAAAHRARGRRVGREGDPPAEQGDRQPRVAPGGVHRPHPERDDPVARGAPAQHHRPVGAVRRAQEDGGLLRRRRLLLPGHRVHPRGRADAGGRAARLPGLLRGRDARGQRPDGQHRGLQRPRRLPEPGRPQERAAAHRQGREQPHRQGRPPLRPADGRAARLRGARPAHGTAGGRRHPGAARRTRTRRTSGRSST